MASRQYVYLAQYCPCIHESEFQTLSVHGAEATAEDTLEMDRKARCRHRTPADYERWRVVRFRILP
jgi:hypothetical protein